MQYVVGLVKDSKIDRLWELACSGYEDFFVEVRVRLFIHMMYMYTIEICRLNKKLQYRDTWIYAAGCKTSESTEFLESLEEYCVSLMCSISRSHRSSAWSLCTIVCYST
jgi:hypothetical protein